LKETTIYGLGGTGSKFISFLLFPLYSRLFNVDDDGASEVINTFLVLASILLTSRTDLAQRYFFMNTTKSQNGKNHFDFEFLHFSDQYFDRFIHRDLQ